MDEQESRTYPIREDMPFQRGSWIAERAGWTAMGVLLLAALAGVFALGPLAHATASTSDGAVRVQYDRFAHKTARTWHVIRVSREPGGEVLVRLSPEFPGAFDIESMDPRPVRSSAGVDGLEYVFAPSKTGDLAVHIGARPKRFGSVAVAVEVEGRGKVAFTQFIYP
jgi:hypothetical protein